MSKRRRTINDVEQVTQDIANHLRRMPHDESAVALDYGYCCSAHAIFHNWRFEFFIDCGELDYLEWAEHGGKRYSFFGNEGITRLTADPVGLLTVAEYNALETWLEAAE